MVRGGMRRRSIAPWTRGVASPSPPSPSHPSPRPPPHCDHKAPDPIWGARHAPSGGNRTCTPGYSTLVSPEGEEVWRRGEKGGSSAAGGHRLYTCQRSRVIRLLASPATPTVTDMCTIKHTVHLGLGETSTVRVASSLCNTTHTPTHSLLCTPPHPPPPSMAGTVGHQPATTSSGYRHHLTCT